ncbi:FAD-binding oxidoreductase [Rhodobacteraceae bacterium HSP-20]|uniref:FAD-binding oxidoreductase n=1 Tax=Paragemmobacter amnigenus TaxID=2852097 RepID=A0ABS6J1G2_9RHOB|nr:FAD-binding oxidoreductase [Rhodobacter amnigenus]MBU9696734.1 FAD-binding oxidoreductase [Rhodobacter amnigenus]MBV4387961.1 FAD-binding oxidoreductase [Rhodobacter amnigenus]
MNLLHVNDRAGEYPPSWYAATRADFPPQPALAGAVRADVCIVGGGYTGLSAALHLAERGLSVIVLEAHRVGFGASGRNGGQVGSGQRLDQDALEAAVGLDDARKLWDFAQEAKDMVRGLIAAHDMPVRFHPGIAHACWQASEVRDAHAYAEKLRRDYGYDQVEPLSKEEIERLIPSGVFAGGEIDRGAGHVHPLNYAIGLARAALAAGAVIQERSEVTKITHGAQPVVETAGGRVTCDHLILACNGYMGGLEPQVAARVMPINNFIVATEPLGDRAREVLSEPVAVADTRFVVNYWRLSEDNRLLFGGGESYGYRFPDIIRTVRKPMLEIYPALRDVRIDHAWGGTLAITMTRNPCFLRVAPNVLSASGYSGHGVALATLAGRILAEAVAGQAERFDLMARLPTPRFPGGVALRWPLLVLAMTWYSMRDRLGL